MTLVLRIFRRGRLRHIRNRRANLRTSLDLVGSFDEWEESCVPSYCHRNWAAALLSWERLFAAVDLAASNSSAKRPNVLDFGASVGELLPLLPHSTASYAFVERHDLAAAYLKHRYPAAQQTTLEDHGRRYDWIFSIDALEHNANYGEILASLAAKLAPGGILILSGPTENAFYRLGRKLARFRGGYYATSIYEIEVAAEELLSRLDTIILYPVLSFFRVSVWGQLRGEVA